ncbi:hypothetical protein [Azospirillum sp. sgz301742]
MIHAVSGGGVLRLGQFTTAVSKTDADGVETTLRSIVIPAGTVGVNDALELVSFWSYPNSATIKSLRTKVGATVLAQADPTTSASFVSHSFLFNRNVVNSQGGERATSTVIGAGGTAFTASAIDFSAAQTINFAALWGTAGAGSNSITLEGCWVNLLRAG